MMLTYFVLKSKKKKKLSLLCCASPALVLLGRFSIFKKGAKSHNTQNWNIKDWDPHLGHPISCQFYQQYEVLPVLLLFITYRLSCGPL